MSGQPTRTPMDIAKFRNAYLANLNLEIANVDKNFKANQVYQRTGAPSQLTDTRTTDEKLADLYKLRTEIRGRLSEIMSGNDANNVVEGLDDNEARFVAQQIDTIIKDIKPKYRLGMPAAAFYTYIMKYMEKFNETQGVEYALQQKTGNQILANQEDILAVLPEKNDINSLKRVVELTGEMQGSVVLRQLDAMRQIIEDLPRIYNSVTDIQNAVMKDEILEAISQLVEDLPAKSQLEQLKRELEVAIENGDRSQTNRVLFKLNEMTELSDEVELEVRELNKDLASQRIDTIPEPESPVLREPTVGMTDNVVKNVSYDYIQPEQLPQLRLTLGNDMTPSLGGYLMAMQKINPMIFSTIFDDTPLATVRNKFKKADIINRLTIADISVRRLWDSYQSRGSGPEILTGRGFGLNPRKRIIGKGVSIDRTKGIESEPDYVPFGKFIVNRKKLLDGILMIKRPNGSFVPDFRTKRLSQNLTNVFRKVAGGSLPSFGDLEKLDDDEREYLRHVARRSNLSSKLEVPSPRKDKNETLINQFEIMRGQLIAGNDSKDLIRKFKTVIIEMLDEELLPKGQAKDILIELARHDY